MSAAASPIAADPRRRAPLPALVVLAVVVATLLGAFGFQEAGYAPCELCLKERLPYYAGLALAGATALAAWRGPRAVATLGFTGLVLLFLFSTAFGAYHAGVEWGAWPGPSDCTGTLDRATSNADFLRQLQTVKVVRCDAVAIRILGLSLAGWNTVISLAIALVAAAGLRNSMKTPAA